MINGYGESNGSNYFCWSEQYVFQSTLFTILQCSSDLVSRRITVLLTNIFYTLLIKHYVNIQQRPQTWQRNLGTVPRLPAILLKGISCSLGINTFLILILPTYI